MNYINIYYNMPESLKDKLKPVMCKSCQDNGDNTVGSCKKCLENLAWNTEYLETHAFIYDTLFRGYHDGYHDTIKSIPLRLPNEHPYLYYGVEIEVEFDSSEVCVYDTDDGYDDDDNWKVQEILDRFSEITEGMFVYEHDGSLDNGVECISRPMSYAYWTHPDTVKRLEAGLEYLRNMGAYWRQPDTNGLHIHISRKFFEHGGGKVDRHSAYQGIDWLFQKFQPEIEKIGERKYTQYCASKTDQLRNNLENNWVLNQCNVDAEVKCKLKKGGDVPCGDHHVAVTLSGATIEARVFKSTTDYKRVLAYIELVRNMAHAVRDDNTEVSLDSLLHTKDNLYLDEIVRETRKQCAKNKEEFDLDKINDNAIDIVVTKESRN